MPHADHSSSGHLATLTAVVHLQYLNCVENGLGLRSFLEEKGWKYITTADKDGPQSGWLCPISPRRLE